MPNTEDEDRFKAAIDYIRRTGASSVQVRYSNDQTPIVWMAIAEYDGRNPAGIKGFEVDAANTPLAAAVRLCERVGDGAICTHCNRPSGFEPTLLLRMPLDDKICWYQYDPELKVYRRGCE